jgi:AraC-like DNA-binding protein
LSELLADQETVVTNKTAEKPAERTDNAVESADADLYKQLTEAIRNEQLYTVQKFGRTELVERFHLSSKRISTAFSVNGTSVPEFIRECRLEHARQLMVERPDMSLVEIATASGFIHASTFTVDFKNKYGVSPTKYREEKQKEKNVVQRE